ncbi:hypothetical protein CWO91_36815 [Bradyrhizobium genosp. SA-3]|uniref:hypothetical protein n=1 Tax=Bradyrhizobium genosp. SA-3 TaxID=508868 RepID=UPI001029FBFB|nr:hypothetical protein [Bradyrhizobium genosp. SA-3]RZM98713.1 hypothetical protein CWO91_36815 [Bradyrhizobium genosp. SA-3]
MDDNRTFIDQDLSRSVHVTGRESTPDEMAMEFAKLGLAERVEHLELIAGEDREYSVEEAAKQFRYRKALASMHERLRKVGR